MGDIFLTGTAEVTKMYIYIQLISIGNKSIMKKEHDGVTPPDGWRDRSVSYSKSNDVHIMKASHGFYRYFNSLGGNFFNVFFPQKQNKITNFYVHRL